MAHPVADSFLKAHELVVQDPRRRGNCLYFAAGEHVVYAGDIHGHRANLAKIIAHAALGRRPKQRLVLQELIHGDPDGPGGDRSLDVLLRAARLKVTYPEQVGLLMGNHDLAQVSGHEITKHGTGMCRAFEASLTEAFGPDAPEVQAAIYKFLHDLPVAGRCANGAFLTHSLPSPGRMHLVDWQICCRPYRPEDYRRGGSLYEWTWGRNHTAEQLAEVADLLQAKYFLLGHQPVEAGFRIDHGQALILASNHARGAIMSFDAGEILSDASLAQHVHPIAGL